jgi:hypothetical protein
MMKKCVILLSVIFSCICAPIYAEDISLNDWFKQLGFETQQTDEYFLARVYQDTKYEYSVKIGLDDGSLFINDIQQENSLPDCKLIGNETYGYLSYFQRLFIDNEGDILVKGYSEFKTAIWDALRDMRENYPDEYDIVAKNLISVSQGERNGAYLEHGFCTLTIGTSSDHKYLMAALLHEATHISDYKAKIYITTEDYENAVYPVMHNFLVKLKYDNIQQYDDQYRNKYWETY